MACAAKIASLSCCRREGIAESLYYSWSKEFLEAGKRRLGGETERASTTGEVKDLRRQSLLGHHPEAMRSRVWTS